MDDLPFSNHFRISAIIQANIVQTSPVNLTQTNENIELIVEL